jgi:uncharacterized protein YgiM (DUF1202 family)
MHATRASMKTAYVGAVLCLALLACNLQAASSTRSPTGVVSTGIPQLPSSAEVPSATAEPGGPTATQAALIASATPTAAALLEPVTVAAAGGRLYVRRGPGAEYNAVGAFLNGQSSKATARNADSTWLYISVPNSTRGYGWITVKTQYTNVTGDASALPVQVVDPAVPAYIRNCTAHEMQVTPGGAILLERTSAPDNEMQFFPGEYSIFDTITETTVAGVTVLEGTTVDIKQDGAGKNFTCP